MRISETKLNIAESRFVYFLVDLLTLNIIMHVYTRQTLDSLSTFFTYKPIFLALVGSIFPGFLCKQEH